ncbi:hypothetical protein DXG03_009765, partial [Asterophora parasitica]
MITSTLADYKEVGWLPMGKNVVDGDYAAYKLAAALGKPDNTGFLETRNTDWSWAGTDNGWTEGAAYKTQARVREIAQNNYNNTPTGLSGVWSFLPNCCTVPIKAYNKDRGQMSLWYIFSAMGFYPVNPVSGEYVVGSAFVDKITIDLPPTPHQENSEKNRRLIVIAQGAPTKPYIESLTAGG